MPLTVKPVLEKYRLRSGRLASRSGENFGAFVLKPGFLFGQARRLQVIVTDGQLAADPAFRWEHVSATVIHLPKGSTRPQFYIPTWNEMAGLKDLFWDPDDCVMQLHVPRADHVDCHPFVLHLWRPLDCEIPRPSSMLVGPRAEK